MVRGHGYSTAGAYRPLAAGFCLDDSGSSARELPIALIGLGAVPLASPIDPSAPTAVAL